MIDMIWTVCLGNTSGRRIAFTCRVVGIPYKTRMSRQLKVKDENLAPIQEVAILRLLGVKSVHFGGQSPGTRLTSQRGRRSELYLPESVYPFGQYVTESEEVPID